mmetsp:Transcript_71/g.97  ORF Transcript_71/g.97 Transcript_71/m.97 type:complete len:84 (-) Transcript_71:42-293(-)
MIQDRTEENTSTMTAVPERDLETQPINDAALPSSSSTPEVGEKDHTEKLPWGVDASTVDCFRCFPTFCLFPLQPFLPVADCLL